MSLPSPAEQTGPHTAPAARCERPLTALLLPGRPASPPPEHGDIEELSSWVWVCFLNTEYNTGKAGTVYGSGLISCRLTELAFASLR